MKPKRGFSLLELLIVVAIIGILMAMLSGALVKALRAGHATAAREAMRQHQIGRMVKLDKGVLHSDDPEKDRAFARWVFHRRVDTGKAEMIVSETVYLTQNDAEFRAY